MTDKHLGRLKISLEKLEKGWPRPIPKDIHHLFEQAKKSLEGLKKNSNSPAKGTQSKFFDFVGLINQVLKTHDLLFLSRHLTYHVVTTTDLPEAFGHKEEALAVLTELLATATKKSSFGSRLEIRMEKVQLREGPAIQIKFLYEGNPLSEEDRQKILEEFYGGASDISFAKATLRKAGGQLWLEFPQETHVSLTFNWPAFDTSKEKISANVGTYKYDIWVTDYAKIRQRFGVTRAAKTVMLVESFVKSLVRHPVDMVLSFPTQGLVTVIYESQEGVASSVSTRISQRLKKESFRLGKIRLTPGYRYQLSLLA